MTMRLALLLCACLLASCSTTTGFENRIAVSPSCDRAWVVSMYRWFGIATEVDPRDLKAVCPPKP